MASASAAPVHSAVSTLIAKESQPRADPDPVAALALEVVHNLRHQHLWTSLQVHEPGSLSSLQSTPLISGTPPHAVYTHPDEQLYMLENGIRPEDTTLEREWVIPTAQGQKWSLRRLTGVFDSLPSRSEDMQLPDSGRQGNVSDKVAEYERRRREEPWVGKRVLLSVVNRRNCGDGTVVYYTVLEGTVGEGASDLLPSAVHRATDGTTSQGLSILFDEERRPKLAAAPFYAANVEPRADETRRAIARDLGDAKAFGMDPKSDDHCAL